MFWNLAAISVQTTQVTDDRRPHTLYRIQEKPWISLTSKLWHHLHHNIFGWKCKTSVAFSVYVRIVFVAPENRTMWKWAQCVKIWKSPSPCKLECALMLQSVAMREVFLHMHVFEFSTISHHQLLVWHVYYLISVFTDQANDSNTDMTKTGASLFWNKRKQCIFSDTLDQCTCAAWSACLRHVLFVFILFLFCISTLVVFHHSVSCASIDYSCCWLVQLFGLLET